MTSNTNTDKLDETLDERGTSAQTDDGTTTSTTGPEPMDDVADELLATLAEVER